MARGKGPVARGTEKKKRIKEWGIKGLTGCGLKKALTRRGKGTKEGRVEG